MAYSDYENNTNELKRVNIIYVTKVTELIKLLFTRLNNHIKAKGNVHGLTANDLGLGKVPNYAIATDAEAAAGTSTNTLINPKQLATYTETQVHVPLAKAFADAAADL